MTEDKRSRSALVDALRKASAEVRRQKSIDSIPDISAAVQEHREAIGLLVECIKRVHRDIDRLRQKTEAELELLKREMVELNKKQKKGGK